MNLRLLRELGCVSLLLLLCSHSALAQDERAMARAQQMLRQLSAENAQLQQELTQLRQEYADYRAQTEDSLAAAQAKQKQLSQSISGLASDGKRTERELEDVRSALAAEQQKVAALQQAVQVRDENMQICEQNNEALADTAYDLIDLYREKGFSEVLIKKEPITGIAKVKVENIVQDYEDRVMRSELEKNPQLLQPLDNPKDNPVAGSLDEP